MDIDRENDFQVENVKFILENFDINLFFNFFLKLYFFICRYKYKELF